MSQITEASGVDGNCPEMSLPEHELTLAYARSLDEKDELKEFRAEFLIPTKSQLKKTKIGKDDSVQEDPTPCTYLCGNSLGLQPKRTRLYIEKYLDTWSQKGVYGHFKPLSDQNTVPWVDIDEQSSKAMANIVGAEPSEVVVMQTLTANLHLLFASFYRPTKERHKIIIESKAFPSDHYAVHSQLYHHNLDPSTSLVIMEPSDPKTHYYSTSHIQSLIAQHASTTALLLLPGVHFYTGQAFDIAAITAFAQARGITVGWDLAHAAGNMPLRLHAWNVDFAAWCSYKYLNGGPGAIAAAFVHARHGAVAAPAEGTPAAEDTPEGVDARLGYRRRLAGWWGGAKGPRFRMEAAFRPMAGAAGWQLSNPSVLDTTSVLASLAVFAEAGLDRLRAKSVRLTAYLERLLLTWDVGGVGRRPYVLLTPRGAAERGAQISVRLEEGLLEGVMEALEEGGVVVDERRPDVVRVAPAPLYNSFEDCWRFMQVFHAALVKAKTKQSDNTGEVMEEGPQGENV